jgi:hypothetical protein
VCGREQNVTIPATARGCKKIPLLFAASIPLQRIEQQAAEQLGRKIPQAKWTSNGGQTGCLSRAPPPQAGLNAGKNRLQPGGSRNRARNTPPAGPPFPDAFAAAHLRIAADVAEAHEALERIDVAALVEALQAFERGRRRCGPTDLPSVTVG